MPHTSRLFAERTLLLLATLLLGACSYLQPFPNTEEHIVARDESLYAIAWRYEVDFRDLAKWNGLYKPYRIYPGQKLVLHPFGEEPRRRPIVQPFSKPEAPRTPARLRTAPVVAQQTQNAKVVNPSPRPSIKPVIAAKPASSAKAEAGATTVAEPITRPVDERVVIVTKAEPPKIIAKPIGRSPKRPVRTRNGWAWPTAGRPSETYKQTGTGITIPGKVGQSIHAARKGKVVYAGSGLKGYGLLVIIKHSDEYLTAYGYNERLLVAQGEEVKPGERIATMGLGPENKSMLHFELRRNGRPVDPMRLLPAPD